MIGLHTLPSMEARGHSTRVVVVGAGSAGAVIAARLSECADVFVTLVEAGPDHRAADVPPEISGASFNAAKDLPDFHWPTLLATRVQGQAPRLYVRGRGVGGSSAINAMVALPGQPADYDAWERVHGCHGWSWRDVEPWFSRTALTLHRAPAHEWGVVNRALADAVPVAAEGAWLTRDSAGRRVSVNDAYLEPARGRPQLTVLGDSVVDRIVFGAGRDARRAIGVRLADGRELDADLVVVSAGAIHSPAILLRSGVDTPGIGDGLQDHPSFPFALVRREPADLTSLPIATIATLSSNIDGHVDDLQLLPMEHAVAAMPQLALLLAAAMRSWSRGTVRLDSNDPGADPVVDFAMLSDERDWILLDAVIDAAELALDHVSFRSVVDVAPYDRSPDGMRAALADYVHAAGTCAMGTVVDTWCRLIGHEGVVVCDASVMPVVPTANTHLPTVMIAERIAAHLQAHLAQRTRDT